MIDTYYLDESGSSGDLVSTGNALDFGQQPVFALACVGVDDPEALSLELGRLKKLHKVQGPELKSSQLRTKPRFVTDLAEYMAAKHLPLIVEIVEKRFQVCATMVNHLVMPAVGAIDLEPRTMWVKNQMAEYMRANMPDGVMLAYIDACMTGSLEATDRAYQAVLSWVQPLSDFDGIAFGVWHSTQASYGDFQELDRAAPESWRSGLPIPDDSKQGKPFWMLPNLSSFTNIYARLNHCHGGKVAGLKLFHDEQLQFDSILHESKAATEGLKNLDAVPSLRFANYAFSEQAHLEFVSSATSPGIQAADVIAGFTMRYVQDMLFSSKPVSDDHLNAFQTLLGLSDPERALGFNFVTTTPQAVSLRTHLA